MIGDSSALRTIGRLAAVLAILALINGLRLVAGTTTIGPDNLNAYFQNDARSIVDLAAIAIGGASMVGWRTRRAWVIRAAAVVVAAGGVVSLVEVWNCVGHWHAEAARLALSRGYPASAAQNHYGRGIEVVVAGGLIAIAAAFVIAARTRTPPLRLGLQEQFPA